MCKEVEGGNDLVWGPPLYSPDKSVYFQSKITEFKTHDNITYNVVFLTESSVLYDDKNLSGVAIRSMWNILSETKHLEESYQEGSKSFEVVLSFKEYKGNRPLLTTYIYNVETWSISWPGIGVNLWADRFLGHSGFHPDMIVDFST